MVKGIGNSNGLFTPRRWPHRPPGAGRPARRQAAGRAGGQGCPVWTPLGKGTISKEILQHAPKCGVVGVVAGTVRYEEHIRIYV